MTDECKHGIDGSDGSECMACINEAVKEMDKEKKMIEFMARAEFGKPIERMLTLHDGTTRFFIINDEGSLDSEYRNYLDPIEGHGHVQRVIDGLDDGEIELYYMELSKECRKWGTGFVSDLLKATCAQKVEALMKAKGADQ